MRVLVTGGAGFIGSHVADACVQAGHEVAVIDDLSRSTRKNLSVEVEFFQGDIRDRDFVERVFAEFRPEVVDHHAAQMDVRRGVREPVFDAQVNILGSITLLEAAVEYKTRHFIYASTAGAAYGEPESSPVPEDAPVRPITPYGISKYTVERYLYTFSHLYGLSYVVLRYGNVYGPRQNPQGEAGVFAIFSEQVLAGVQPVIYGDGGKVRDYIYVEDVVRANLAAILSGHGETMNIASGTPTSDLEVFSLVTRLLGHAELRPNFAGVRPGEIQKICMDISKAKRLLDWAPLISLEEGARRTVAYFQQATQNAARAATAGNK